MRGCPRLPRQPRQARVGDGAKEVPGVDIGADLATRARVVEESAPGGSEELHEVDGSRVDRRIARVKGR